MNLFLWSIHALLLASMPLAAQTEMTVSTISAIELDWSVVNDTVMGGRSSSRVEVDGDSQLRFSGELSLENNGGFASIRSGIGSLSFADSDSVRLRVLGDGRSYQLRLYSRQRFRGEPVAYVGEFRTRSGQWTTAELRIADLRPRYRGQPLQAPVLSGEQVIGIGLLLGDGQPGPFQLMVEQISLHR